MFIQRGGAHASINLQPEELKLFRVILNRSAGCPNKQVADLVGRMYQGLFPPEDRLKYRQLTLEEGIKAQLEENESQNGQGQDDSSFRITEGDNQVQ